MKETEKDKEVFLQRVNEHLDQALDELDPQVQRRLQAARQRALQQRGPLTAQPGIRWALGGAAAAIVVGVLISLPHDTPQPAPTVLEDMRLLSSGEELELYEDLEFYHWLESSQQG